MGSDFGDEVGVVEDLVEPLRGWRTWKVASSGSGSGRNWYLTSTTLTYRGRCYDDLGGGNLIWPAAGMEARCYCAQMQARADRGDPVPHPSVRLHHPCPGPPAPANQYGIYLSGHGCGVYAVRSYEALMSSHWARDAHVVGEVELGGRVWEHGGGWRAQYARPVRILHSLPHLRFALRRPRSLQSVEDALGALRRRYDCGG